MTAISLAIIGKNGEPLYLKEFLGEDASSPSDHLSSEEELFGLPPKPKDPSSCSSGSSCSVRQQFLLHSALDRFEQLAGPPPGCAWRAQGVAGTDAMWVGLLYPIQDMRVYGYMTTTQIKFILIVYDDAVIMGDQSAVDNMIKELLAEIHRLYVDYTLNPFSTIDAPISSARFDTRVKDCVAEYNKSFP